MIKIKCKIYIHGKVIEGWFPGAEATDTTWTPGWPDTVWETRGRRLLQVVRTFSFRFLPHVQGYISLAKWWGGQWGAHRRQHKLPPGMGWYCYCKNYFYQKLILFSLAEILTHACRMTPVQGFSTALTTFCLRLETMTTIMHRMRLTTTTTMHTMTMRISCHCYHLCSTHPLHLNSQLC